MSSFGSTGQRVIGTVRTVRMSGTSPFAQGIMLLSAVVIGIVLLPLLLIAVLACVGVVGFLWAKRWLQGQRKPNGVLDGRKNVRVRLPAE